jgi:hypothetical protein
LIFAFPEIAPITQFLRWCSAVPLETFHASFCEVVTANDMRAVFTAISAGCSHSYLLDLTIGTQCEQDELLPASPTEYLLPLPTIRLLFRFANLTTLNLKSLIGFDLDDDAVAELARAWPQIVTLRLEVRFATHAPKATLSCLHSFAEHCPCLTRLVFPFDGTAVPAASAPPLVHRRLKTLGVEHSPLGLATPISAARFLSGVFPNLMEIETHREYDENDDEDEMLEHGEAVRLHTKWKVMALLPEVKAIREEVWMAARATLGG